jgi:hypothetical protein
MRKDDEPMNRTSRIAAVIGLILIALAGLFPPVVHDSYYVATARRGFLLSPSLYAKQRRNRILKSSLDLPRLAVEWISIAAATGAVCLALHRAQKEN